MAQPDAPDRSPGPDRGGQRQGNGKSCQIGGLLPIFLEVFDRTARGDTRGLIFPGTVIGRSGGVCSFSRRKERTRGALEEVEHPNGTFGQPSQPAVTTGFWRGGTSKFDASDGLASKVPHHECVLGH